MSKLPTREEYEKRERDKADMEHEISIRLSRPALLNEIETLREHIAELEQALKMATDTIAEYQNVLAMFDDEGSYEVHVEIDEDDNCRILMSADDWYRLQALTAIPDN